MTNIQEDGTMANSHFPASVWKKMIADVLHGNAIGFSAKRLGLYHQAAFTVLWMGRTITA